MPEKTPQCCAERREPLASARTGTTGTRGLNRQVGTDIRALRKSRGLTLQALAEATGRSAGWLSLIERGQAEPSIRDLEKIAALFGLTISFFFRSAGRAEREQGLVLRQEDRMPIGSDESGLVEELLSPSLDGAFEMMRSVFAPGASRDEMRPRAGREDGAVLVSGHLTLFVDGESFDLHPGDSFQFSGRAYGWRNDGPEPAVAIWVVSPPVY